MALTITLLGTGGPLPDPNRAGPATLIFLQEDKGEELAQVIVDFIARASLQ